MPEPDLTAIRRAVQLRDRCRHAAIANGARLGVPLSGVQANIAYDAISGHLAAAALRDMADRIDRGPTFPIPPSVISALVRERADDLDPTTQET